MVGAFNVSSHSGNQSGRKLANESPFLQPLKSHRIWEECLKSGKSQGNWSALKMLWSVYYVLSHVETMHPGYQAVSN